MLKQGNTYTFIFALIICVTCSLALSFVSEVFKDKRLLNEELDVKKNILKAVQLKEPLSAKLTPDEVLSIYKEKIEEVVIDRQGNVVEGKAPAELNPINSVVDATSPAREYLPLYIYKEDDAVVSYAFPIVGQGLWSTLYGYFAIEPDAVTVRGITYYKHGETPGLGAEIEQDWFQGNFKGKKIWNAKDNELQPISVVKGKVEDFIPKDKQDFYVDGISGATMTTKGVTQMLQEWTRAYEPFLSKKR